MALPSFVAASNETLAAAGADRLAVKCAIFVPESPSLMDRSPIDSVGVTAASSSVIVPVALPSPIVAPPITLARLTVKVSFGSSTVSPLIVMLTTLLVSPAARVWVKLAAW